MADRGATLVEYALLVALIVVVSIPAIDRLSSQSADEVANQADCIATRPPPPGCQLPPVPPAPTPTVPGPPEDEDGSAPPSDCDPTDDLEACEPPTSQASWAATPTATPLADGYWEVNAQVMLLDDEGSPVAGAVVRFRFRTTQPNWPGAATPVCVTDAAGTCSVAYQTPIDDAQQVTLTITSVDADPAVDPASLPAGWQVAAP